MANKNISTSTYLNFNFKRILVSELYNLLKLLTTTLNMNAVCSIITVKFISGNYTYATAAD